MIAIGQGREERAATGNVVVLAPGDTMEEIVRKAAHLVPSQRQLAWQELEFNAFVHFGINTFTDREWGLGNESPALFNPTDLDARQWVRVIKEGGMRMVIVTAKHHDGFCLWPSRYTDHSVRNSPWRGGRGDVVGEVASACREFGMKFGVYLSPWDRHELTYGDSPKYNEHFRNQLRELLSNYGEISEVWFDGASGEGPNGKKQVYDWPSYYRVVRELQPKAVIAIMGPDVRWVGTESGYGRETEWSVVPDVVKNLDLIAGDSREYALDGAFAPRDLMAGDLGGREKIRGAKTLLWYPSETDVSIRPGWFYHADQDRRVKSPRELVDIYFSSVGRNSVLLLNIPPDRRGRIHGSDIKSLRGMRKILDRIFATDMALRAEVRASSERQGHSGALSVDNDNGTYWTTGDGAASATLEYVLPSRATFDCAMLQECIRAGQRVERFHIDAGDGTGWRRVAEGTTIGYRRLLRFPAVTAATVRLVIDQSRSSPTISTFGLFQASAGVKVGQDRLAQEALDDRVRKFLEAHESGWEDLNIPARDGQFLYDLIVRNRYTRALEIGTSTGHSAIWIAWALSRTGGKLITIEIDEGRRAQAVENFRQAGVSEFIDARLADAHDLVRELKGPFDFVFSDADKGWYKQYFAELAPKMSVGGCFTAHNITPRDGVLRGYAREFVEFVRGYKNFDTSVEHSRSSGISVSFKRSP